MSNHVPEYYEQEYLQKEARYVWTARIAVALGFLFVIVAGKCPDGSIVRAVLTWIAVLCGIVMLTAFYAHLWNRFKYRITNRGVRTFLFFNRVGEGFYSVMAALPKFLAAGANYYLKKKSRTEQNQQLILQRMAEMQEEGRQTGGRIEGQLVSLREDIAEEAKVLLAIRKDNEDALKRHCEQEAHWEEEIALIKAEIQEIRTHAEANNLDRLTQLEEKLDQAKRFLYDEQERIDRLEEERDALSKERTASFTFKDLVLGRAAKRKAAALEKMAREIAEEYKNEKKEYLYELAKFYHAMLDLGYIRENESKFATIFHREYGGNRDFDAYRRSFHNAVDRLIDYEYEDIQEEIEDLVNG